MLGIALNIYKKNWKKISSKILGPRARKGFNASIVQCCHIWPQTPIVNLKGFISFILPKAYKISETSLAINLLEVQFEAGN